MNRHSVLFVCLGNICRSPTAEGIFRQQLAQEKLQDVIAVDSAGTGDWHIGNQPDARAREAALRRGYDIRPLRARQISIDDFLQFDDIVAMDFSNQRNLHQLAISLPDPEVVTAQDKIAMMLSFDKQTRLQEVPDPYYGGDGGFDQVIDLLENACAGLLDKIKQNLHASGG